MSTAYLHLPVEVDCAASIIAIRLLPVVVVDATLRTASMHRVMAEDACFDSAYDQLAKEEDATLRIIEIY